MARFASHQHQDQLRRCHRRAARHPLHQQRCRPRQPHHVGIDRLRWRCFEGYLDQAQLQARSKSNQHVGLLSCQDRWPARSPAQQGEGIYRLSLPVHQRKGFDLGTQGILHQGGYCSHRRRSAAWHSRRRDHHRRVPLEGRSQHHLSPDGYGEEHLQHALW